MHRKLRTTLTAPRFLLFEIERRPRCDYRRSKYRVHSVGLELRPDLFEESRDRIKQLGLEDRVQIIDEDMFNATIRRATVVTLYLHIRP